MQEGKRKNKLFSIPTYFIENSTYDTKMFYNTWIKIIFCLQYFIRRMWTGADDI